MGGESRLALSCEEAGSVRSVQRALPFHSIQLQGALFKIPGGADYGPISGQL